MQGLYIHIPFCVRKCNYCDFFSLAGRLDLLDAYINSILGEASKYAGMPFETFYMGGGTPSLLGAGRLTALIDGLNQIFDLHGLFESSIEVNPDSADVPLLKAALQSGFNRISIGVQSMNDAELRKSGRVHTADQAKNCIENALKCGFNNVSADIIIGLPGQTEYSLRETLHILLEEGVNHISAYCLSIEEGTPFATKIPADMPDDDFQAEMYQMVEQVLTGSGFAHYEISNFARPGFQCMHNINYWRGGDYIGLGVAAASHLNRKRWKNASDLEAYLIDPLKIEIEYDVLASLQKISEETILKLRLLTEGVDLSAFQNRYDTIVIDNLMRRLDAMVEEGKLVRRELNYLLPDEKVLISNRIFAEILD